MQNNCFQVFLLVLRVLYVKLAPIIIWPERSELIASMSMCFWAKVGTEITTIIDYFELYIETPTNLSARSLIWSYYKNNNTVKCFIGITPQGTICFISKCLGWTYKGSACDRKFWFFEIFNLWGHRDGRSWV